jgi:hypothetical protein
MLTRPTDRLLGNNGPPLHMIFYLHFLEFLHFTAVGMKLKGHKNSDTLQKIQILSEILNRIFSKFYNYWTPTSRPSSKTVVFKQYIPKKHKHFSKRIHQQCYTTCDMRVYLGKNRQCMAQHLRATHASERNDSESRRMWSKIVNGQFFSSMTYMVIWQRINITDVGLSHQTGRVCPKP